MTLKAAIDLIGRFHRLEADMTIAKAYCLLLIAKNEGLSLKELSSLSSVKMPSASRYVSELSETSVHGEPGLGLVTAREDPMERRKKIIQLTPKGKVLVGKLLGEK